MPFYKTFLNKLTLVFGASLFSLILASCASFGNFFLNQPPKDTQSQKNQIQTEKPKFKLVYIKTAMFRFYDYGIISFEPNEIKLELFQSGKSIGSIRVKKSQICFLNDCAPKWPAAKNFFGKVSYGDLFDDILLGKDIFGGIGKQIGADGAMIQRFQKSGEIIFYERKPGHTLFRNMATGVAISIDDYDDPSASEEESK